MAPVTIPPEQCVRIFCRVGAEPVLQYGVSFVLGVILSPWSTGIFYLLVGLLLYEIIIGILAASYSLPYPVSVRAGIIGASILGFIVGRELFQQDPLDEGW